MPPRPPPPAAGTCSPATIDGTFLAGANLPWINYGWDFGPCEWGHGYKPDKFEAAFADLAARGANCVRLWVFGDGRAQPTMDAKNRNLTVGLDPQFFADFDDMVARAGKHGVRLVPVLWDFIAMNGPGKGDKPTRTQGLRGPMFTDPDLANAFMERALRPLVTR